jgi:hypothetical protein
MTPVLWVVAICMAPYTVIAFVEFVADISDRMPPMRRRSR